MLLRNLRTSEPVAQRKPAVRREVNGTLVRVEASIGANDVIVTVTDGKSGLESLMYGVQAWTRAGTWHPGSLGCPLDGANSIQLIRLINRLRRDQEICL